MTVEKFKEAENVYDKMCLVRHDLEFIDGIKKSALNGKIPIHKIQNILNMGADWQGKELIDLDVLTLDIFKIVEEHLRAELKKYEKQLAEL